MTDNEQLLKWIRIEKTREGFVSRYKNLVKRSLYDMTRRLRKSILEVDSLKDMEDIIDAIPQDTDAMEKRIRGIYVTVGSGFAKTTLDDIKAGRFKSRKSTDVDAIDSSYFQTMMQQYANMYGAEKVVSITNTNKQVLKRILDKAIAEGWGVPRIKKEIQAYWQQVTSKRAVMIARTEIMSSSSYGTMAGAKATGLQLQKIWLATPHGDYRINHLGINHKKIGFSELYDLGFGINASHPHDPNLPASEVINCRCSIAFEPYS